MGFLIAPPSTPLVNVEDLIYYITPMEFTLTAVDMENELIAAQAAMGGHGLIFSQWVITKQDPVSEDNKGVLVCWQQNL